jgi:hypothetical protein
MPRSYYYLVAGLPDIVLDNTKKGLTLDAFISDVSEQIHENDVSLLSLFRLPFDNKNLVNLLEKQEKKFDERGNFSQDILEQEIKQPDSLPFYMKTFLEAYKEEKLPFPELSFEDQLNWLFYDEATDHDNPFIRDWLIFDLDLRNVLAGLNCRKMARNREGDFSLAQSIICKNDVTELIHKSNAPDFSLSNKLPWIEKVVSLNSDDLVEYEKSIDTLRWDILNELTIFTYFQIETILAFIVKLDMVERWQKLDPETGKEKLEKLLSELKTGHTDPMDFS